MVQWVGNLTINDSFLNTVKAMCFEKPTMNISFNDICASNGTLPYGVLVCRGEWADCITAICQQHLLEVYRVVVG